MREDSGLTYSQLAAIFGKSEGAVRSWEMSRSTPDVGTLIAIAKHFDCTTDYLLGLSEVKNKDEKRRTDSLLQNFIEEVQTKPGYLSLLDALTAIMKDSKELNERKIFSALTLCILNIEGMINDSAQFMRMLNDKKTVNSEAFANMLLGFSNHREIMHDRANYLWGWANVHLDVLHPYLDVRHTVTFEGNRPVHSELLKTYAA